MRSAILSEGRLRAPPALEAAANPVDGGLGFLRRHFASFAARNGLGSGDLSRAFANPRLCRFFSSESPKKKSMDQNPKILYGIQISCSYLCLVLESDIYEISGAHLCVDSHQWLFSRLRELLSKRY